MRIPQLAERMKAAPVATLRSVFAGIGQALMASDRAVQGAGKQETSKPGSSEQDSGRPGSSEQNRSRPGSGKPDSPQPRWRSLDETGNVRLLSAADLAEDAAERPTSPPADPQPRDPQPRDPQPRDPQPRDPQPAPGEPAPLPVPGYDGLSIASLRARLRNLDQAQLRVLHGYERTHACRTDVLTMFERRIAKLDSAQDLAGPYSCCRHAASQLAGVAGPGPHRAAPGR